MVIFGKTEEEHDRNLILFLETTRKNGLILNKRKLQFKKEEVSFLRSQMEFYRNISRSKEDWIYSKNGVPTW